MADEGKDKDLGLDGQKTDAGTGDATGGTSSDKEGTQNSGETAVTFTPEQQAQVDKLIAARLGRAKDKWTAEAEDAKKKAEEAAEAERLEAQKEYEALAQKRGAKLAELEPQVATLNEQVETYKAALEAYAKTALEGVPEHVLPLLQKLDPVEQLEYVAKHGEAWIQKPGGVPKTPRPGDGNITEDERRKRSRRTRL